MTSPTLDLDNLFTFYRGRVALYYILRSLGVSSGDEVILQAFTCLAVPSPILGMGARPVYVDLKTGTFNLDPGKLEERITDKTKAIIVQHTFGIPAEMGLIGDIARRHGISVVEDCCHVLDSCLDGKPLGMFGEAAFYSYEWGKPVVAGIGGGAIAHSARMEEGLRSYYRECIYPPLSRTGQIHLQYLGHRILKRPSLYWTVRAVYHFLSRRGLLIGNFPDYELDGDVNEEYSWKMASSLARRVQRQLAGLKDAVAHRKKVQDLYEEGFTALGIPRIKVSAGVNCTLLRYPLLVRNKPAVLAAAREHKVELGDWFASPVDPLESDQWAGVWYLAGSCPVAEDVARRIITLPIYEGVGRTSVTRALGFLSDMQAAGYV